MTDTVEQASAALRAELHRLDADALERLVTHHNEKYWRDAAPEIDDATFDVLVEALRKARPTSPVLDALGDVAGADRRFSSTTHSQPMLSLDKCYDDATLNKWREKIPGRIVVTPKIDGVACALRYDEAGTLSLAATRGDGKSGDVITDNVLRIASIPSTLPRAVTEGQAVEVRGEVYMPLSRFRAHYANDFANPRNLTAGALKQKEAEKSAAYGLAFFAYDLLGTKAATEVEKAATLTKLGFALPPQIVVEPGDDLAASFRTFEAQRGSFDYETDGVVMKADDIALQRKLGNTAHHPRYAMAYKFQGEGAQTELVDVEWSVARSGVITPVAVVRPVFVSGATVTRASLHNAGFIEKLGLTEDAKVEIVRRGGVIPKVERVLAAGGAPIAIPTACPCGQTCTTHLEGDFLYCSAPDDCPEVVRGRISHFLKTIDVIGFGPKHLTQLMDRKLVRGIVDLYRLEHEDLVKLERMGDTLAQKLLTELSAKRRLPLDVFLTALGIDEVGSTVAQVVVDAFPTLDALRRATVEELSELHGVGPAIARALAVGLARRAAEIDELLTEIDVVQTTPTPAHDASHPLAGKSVVFTGKLALSDRKSAQQRVKACGGRTPGAVSKDLDYLVIGDEGSPLLGDGKKSSKHKKAEQLKAAGAAIEIISESAFAELLDGPGT